ncbi:MAG: hypothetical protein ACLQKY_15285 [Terracidiphilus sp.]
MSFQTFLHNAPAVTRLLVFALLACSCLAQNTPGTPAPQDPLDTERWFVGDWLCTGVQHPSPTAPAVPFTDRFNFRMVLDGSWLSYQLHQVEGPHRGQLTLIGAITWDANARLHVRRDMNIGGSRMDMTSPGWEAGKLIFTGFMVTGDQKLPATQTFTKKSHAETVNGLEIRGPDGNPVAWENETCKRVR